jgi:hypothetical protein
MSLTLILTYVTIHPLVREDYDCKDSIAKKRLWSWTLSMMPRWTDWWETTSHKATLTLTYVASESEDEERDGPLHMENFNQFIRLAWEDLIKRPLEYTYWAWSMFRNVKMSYLHLVPTLKVRSHWSKPRLGKPHLRLFPPITDNGLLTVAFTVKQASPRLHGVVAFSRILALPHLTSVYIPFHNRQWLADCCIHTEASLFSPPWRCCFFQEYLARRGETCLSVNGSLNTGEASQWEASTSVSVP